MKIPRIFPLAILLGGMLSSMPAQADRALVIGIDDYRIEPARVPPLSGAVRDAQNIRSLLIDSLGYRAEDIRVLLDQGATRKAILGSIREWLVEGSKPGERVFFYYAGHGSEIPSNAPDAEQGYDQTLVPVDTDGEGSNMITDKELKAAFVALKGRRATAVFDSCHSGSVTRAVVGGELPAARTPLALNAHLRAATRSHSGGTRSTAAENRGASTLLDRRDDLTVWSAVTASQYALEDRLASEPQGVFTARFVDGIRNRKADRNGDGRIAHAELFDWVSTQSTTYCDRLKKEKPRYHRECARGIVPTLEIARHLQAQPVETTMGTEAPATLSVAKEAETILAPASSTLPKGSLVLRFLSGPEFRLGDTMQVEVSSSVAGYLTLFDISATGAVTQIYPNPRSAQIAQAESGSRFRPGDERRILQGEKLTLPTRLLHGFDWAAGEPLGEGRFVAVVTAQYVDLEKVASASRGVIVQQSREEALDYVQTIADLLREPLIDGDTDRPAGWQVASARYSIRD